MAGEAIFCFIIWWQIVRKSSIIEKETLNFTKLPSSLIEFI